MRKVYSAYPNLTSHRTNPECPVLRITVAAPSRLPGTAAAFLGTEEAHPIIKKQTKKRNLLDFFK